MVEKLVMKLLYKEMCRAVRGALQCNILSMFDCPVSPPHVFNFSGHVLLV